MPLFLHLINDKENSYLLPQGIMCKFVKLIIKILYISFPGVLSNSHSNLSHWGLGIFSTVQVRLHVEHFARVIILGEKNP